VCFFSSSGFWEDERERGIEIYFSPRGGRNERER
jgi:hypothetical protein